MQLRSAPTRAASPTQEATRVANSSLMMGALLCRALLADGCYHNPWRRQHALRVHQQIHRLVSMTLAEVDILGMSCVCGACGIVCVQLVCDSMSVTRQPVSVVLCSSTVL